ncbi:MAG: hypothetical protein U0641_03750 [Anaerolineae bacterium]
MSEGMTPADEPAVTPAEPTAGEGAAAAGLEDYGTIEHTTRGRTRLRLKREMRTPENMAKIQDQLSSHEDVTGVTINQQTGSVVVNHASHRKGEEICKEALGELELIGGAVFELPEDEGEGGEGGGGGYAKLDQQMADLLYKIDYRVWKKTGLHFRGQILAGSIAGLGVAQMLIFGISLEMLPGPLLLWIAWDIYHRETQETPFEERFAEEEAADMSDEVVGAAGTAPAPA